MTIKKTLYGRRKGHKLRSQKQDLMDTLLPQLKIELPEEEVNPEVFFENSPKEIWLEIGFGGGEHLAFQAERNSENGIIGSEPFINGIASLLAHAQEKELENVRIFPDDCRDLIAKLKEASLSRVYILFPDPWPKKRHFKRRLVNQELLTALFRVLKPGGLLTVASDHPSYIEWIQEHLEKHPKFTPVSGHNVEEEPKDWIKTRYQQKAEREGRKSFFFLYNRC